VTIFSMHGAKNYPFRKVPSTIDIDLPDGTDDDAYLRILAEHLPFLLDGAPDIVFYQCGVDPLVHDALGRLSLTFDGLRERDRMVMQACRDRHIPVMLALGGGYADPIELTIEAQCGTYEVAKQVYAP
jgi:acetoin utilization deacetylase AcuC-like enzyme